MPFIRENELGFLDMVSGFGFKGMGKGGGNLPQEYGLEWRSDTDTYTRLGKAEGKIAVTGGQNDFDSLAPWNGLKRCVLKDDGSVNYYLDAKDSTKKEDGTAADLTGASGQVMVEIPKFWYKCEYPDANTFRFWISDKAKSGYEVHPAFFRDRNNDGVAEEVDKRYFSAFEGYYNTTKLESISGVTPTTSYAIGNFRTYAQNRGNGWGQQDYYLTYAIQMLYLIEYAHFDSQTKIGKGSIVTGSRITTGRTLTLGNKSGNESNIGTDGLKAVSYRGIENLWGNVNTFIDGYITDGSRNILIGNKGFNNIGTGYTLHITNLSANISGYISDIFQNKILGFTPKQCSGSATTKLRDSGDISTSSVPVYGGMYSSGSTGGAYRLECNAGSTTTSVGTGSRLTY